MSNNKFGIEVELYGVTELAACRAVKDALGGELGQFSARNWRGTEVRRVGVKHDDGRITYVVKDASVPFEGREVVSPILEGDVDVTRWLHCVDNLKAIGAKCSSVGSLTVGLHVHVSNPALTPVAASMLVRNWWRHEDFLVAGLAVETERLRRYTKRLERGGNATRVWLDKPETLEDLALSWYGIEGNLPERIQDHYDDARYFTLNLCPFFTLGTVEGRIFNGSLDSAAIGAYAALMGGFVGQSIADSVSKKTSAVKKPLSGNNAADKATLSALLGKLKISKEHHAHLTTGLD